MLGNQNRWSDKDWWLERRMYHWPPALREAGRKLLRKQDRWPQLPPWSPCREYCTGEVFRDRTGELVMQSWQCRWTALNES
jgi:hypothetical protein